jgi:hypothetical protein
MLESALPHAAVLREDQVALLKAAMKKAWKYNGFRNRLAHGEAIMNLTELRG